MRSLADYCVVESSAQNWGLFFFKRLASMRRFEVYRHNICYRDRVKDSRESQGRTISLSLPLFSRSGKYDIGLWTEI